MPFRPRVQNVVQVRFVDLFSGIGGFHVALEQAIGATCVFASDIDETCQDTYFANFGVRPAGDIVPLVEGSIQVPDHDFLCAGFPCQPFSKSGMQRGINEARGTLFYSILRVLEARRPAFVLLENVRNLAGPRHRDTWTTIVRMLRELGYRVSDEPTILSPHLLPPHLGGRPQVRERVFIPAVYVGEGAHIDDLIAKPLARNLPQAGWNPQNWNIEDYLQGDDEIRNLDSYVLRKAEVEWLDTWNELLRRLPPTMRLPGFPLWADAFRESPEIADGVPAWKRDFLLKNSAFYRANREHVDQWLRANRQLAALPPSRRKFEWQAQNAPRDVWQLVLHLRPSGIRVKRGTYLPALVAINQTSVIGWRRRRITPREAARLQGFPDDFVLHGDDAVAYRHLGNAVNVGVVSYLAAKLVAAKSTVDGATQLALPIAV